MSARSVYFAQCGPFFKVGLAADVGKRLVALQVGNPVEITATYAHPGGRGLELKVHEELQGRGYPRARGEWFEGAPSPEDCRAIAQAAEARAGLSLSAARRREAEARLRQDIRENTPEARDRSLELLADLLPAAKTPAQREWFDRMRREHEMALWDSDPADPFPVPELPRARQLYSCDGCGKVSTRQGIGAHQTMSGCGPERTALDPEACAQHELGRCQRRRDERGTAFVYDRRR